MQNDSATASGRSVRIAGEHGYRIEGDTAFLNAELTVEGDETQPTAWALQLWACEKPHGSGAISGVKVAEAPVQLPSSPDVHPVRLEVEALVSPPARQGEYSMVLAVASGQPGGFEQLHDFANYANRQWFAVPHLDGAMGYSIQTDGVVLKVERIGNPRSLGSLSGSLQLAHVELGQVAGQDAIERLEKRVSFSPPPPGEWQIVLALREWTAAAGFVTRDFCNFFVPFRSPVASPVTTPDAAALGHDVAPVRPHVNGATSPSPVAPETLPFPAAPETTTVWDHDLREKFEYFLHDAHDSRMQSPPTHEEIAVAAYYRYLARGEQPGGALDDWLEAERELMSQRGTRRRGPIRQARTLPTA
jgi:hypothetical protein